jgi:hypothetical protein
MISKMKKTILLLTGLGVLLSGCIEKRIEYSDIRHEDAIVAEKQHKDANHSPHPVFDYPEQNLIFFDGAIDFIIDNKEVYNKFNEGDKADISYREKYRYSNRKTYRLYDNRTYRLEKVLLKEPEYPEFVDAQPIKE